ncbi:MAG TPA: response regulator [Verrucomicrobiae bacterium]|nr:response regulator [Verrucomicrobiae bacterium]
MSDHVLFLVVEDNEDHVLLIERAFAKCKVLNPIQVVRSGQEAVDYLSGKGRYTNREEFPLPGLLLLDLKMPGMDGFDVLRWIRQQPGLRALRVVVLTSSNEIRDVNLAYQLGANSFLVKPADFDDFVRVTQALQGYWLWTDKEPQAFRPPRRGEPRNGGMSGKSGSK